MGIWVSDRQTQEHHTSEPSVGQEARFRTIRAAAVLTEVVLLLHLLWCGWVVAGWKVTRRRPILRALHIGSVVYSIVVESVPWLPCPLTLAETWLEARAGVEPARMPFLLRLLDAVVYPDLPEWLVVSGAVVVCIAILCLYLRRYLRNSGIEQW